MHKVFAWLAGLSFLCVFGTVGAMDANTISLLQAIIQLVVFTILSIVFTIGYVLGEDASLRRARRRLKLPPVPRIKIERWNEV